MNDPLRDNRIFPEEMHEHAPAPTTKHMNFSWVWFLLSAAVIIVLLWLVFLKPKTLQKSLPDGVVESPEQQAFQKLQDSRPEVSPQEREDKINALFGNQ